MSFNGRYICDVIFLLGSEVGEGRQTMYMLKNSE